jgi:hypothetical protein
MRKEIRQRLLALYPHRHYKQDSQKSNSKAQIFNGELTPLIKKTVKVRKISCPWASRGAFYHPAIRRK